MCWWYCSVDLFFSSSSSISLCLSLLFCPLYTHYQTQLTTDSLFVKSNLQALVDGTPCGRGTDGYEWDYCDPEAQQSTSTATVTSTSSTATATTVTKTWPTTTTKTAASSKTVTGALPGNGVADSVDQGDGKSNGATSDGEMLCTGKRLIADVANGGGGGGSDDSCWCGGDCYACRMYVNFNLQTAGSRGGACIKCKNAKVLFEEVCISAQQCFAVGGSVKGTGRFGRTCIHSRDSNNDGNPNGGDGAPVAATTTTTATGSSGKDLGGDGGGGSAGSTIGAPPGELVCTGKLVTSAASGGGGSCWCGGSCHTCVVEAITFDQEASGGGGGDGVGGGGSSTLSRVSGSCRKCKNGDYLLGGECVSRKTCTATTGIPQGSGNFNRVCRVNIPQQPHEPSDAATLIKVTCTGVSLSAQWEGGEAAAACSCSNVESSPGAILHDCHACDYYSNPFKPSEPGGGGGGGKSGVCTMCKNKAVLLFGRCHSATECVAAGGVVTGSGRFRRRCDL